MAAGALRCGSDLFAPPSPDGVEPPELAPAELPSPSTNAVARCWAETHPIAFISNRAASVDWQLYVMSTDGVAVRLARGHIQGPVWSPDGRFIAMREHDIVDYDVEYVTELAIIDPDGNERVTLLVEASGMPARIGSYRALDGPSWSADGERLAFASLRDGAWHAWEVPVTGGAPRRLLPQLAEPQLWPSWSPRDPDRLAVVLGESDRDIWIVDVRDPGSARNLTRGRVVLPEAPRWSPDGFRLAFSAEGDALGGGAREIYVIDASGEGLRRVTNDAADDVQPVWSPDGSQLLFSSNRARLGQEGRAAGTDPVDLWLLPLESATEARVLTSGRGGHGIADWAWASGCARAP